MSRDRCLALVWMLVESGGNMIRSRRGAAMFLPRGASFRSRRRSGQRRTQFVADSGEEAAFEQVGFFGLLPGRRRICFAQRTGRPAPGRLLLAAGPRRRPSPAGIHRQQHEAELATLKVQRQRHQDRGAARPASVSAGRSCVAGKGPASGSSSRTPCRSKANKHSSPSAPAPRSPRRGPGNRPRPPGPAAQPPGCPSARRGVRRSGCAGSGRRAAVCPARPGSAGRRAPAAAVSPTSTRPCCHRFSADGSAVADSAGSSPPRMADSPACQTLTSRSASASRCRRSFSVPRKRASGNPPPGRSENRRPIG